MKLLSWWNWKNTHQKNESTSEASRVWYSIGSYTILNFTERDFSNCLKVLKSNFNYFQLCAIFPKFDS